LLLLFFLLLPLLLLFLLQLFLLLRLFLLELLGLLLVLLLHLPLLGLICLLLSHFRVLLLLLLLKLLALLFLPSAELILLLLVLLVYRWVLRRRDCRARSRGLFFWVDRRSGCGTIGARRWFRGFARRCRTFRWAFCRLIGGTVLLRWICTGRRRGWRAVSWAIGWWRIGSRFDGFRFRRIWCGVTFGWAIRRRWVRSGWPIRFRFGFLGGGLSIWRGRCIRCSRRGFRGLRGPVRWRRSSSWLRGGRDLHRGWWSGGSRGLDLPHLRGAQRLTTVALNSGLAFLKGRERRGRGRFRNNRACLNFRWRFHARWRCGPQDSLFCGSDSGRGGSNRSGLHGFRVHSDNIFRNGLRRS